MLASAVDYWLGFGTRGDDIKKIEIQNLLITLN